MSWGSILVGVALTLVLVAYVARPFRRTGAYRDQEIEAWVTQARREAEKLGPPDTAAGLTGFCPQCGRRVEHDHDFCPGCGTRLPGERGAGERGA